MAAFTGRISTIKVVNSQGKKVNQEVTTWGTLWYHLDRLGSVIAISDVSGSVLEQYRYDPFGKPYVLAAKSATDPALVWKASGSSKFGNTKLYTGRDWDASMKAYWYRARTYSPSLGRFLQRDPLWYADGANPYAYVGNSPWGATDPSGEVRLDRVLRVEGAIQLGVDIVVDAGVVSEGLGAAAQGLAEYAQANLIDGDPCASKRAVSRMGRGFGTAALGAAASVMNLFDVVDPTGAASAVKHQFKDATKDHLEKQLRRPYIRKPTRQGVDDVTVRDPRTGRAIDPNLGTPIEGKPDLGHKPDHEFWRERDRAKNEGLSQKEFNDRMNNPELYQYEDPASNRSHRFEKK